MLVEPIVATLLEASHALLTLTLLAHVLNEVVESLSASDEVHVFEALQVFYHALQVLVGADELLLL